MGRLAIVVTVVLGLARSAAADEKPWAKGVPESEQKIALALYNEGNAEFTESRYPQALTKYREALKHWDHPGIRFNMVVCLVNMDQPLEASEHLERALAFGDQPLGADVYSQGLTYKKLLDGQLARLKVACKDDDAQVKLDGVQLLSCPGEARKLLVPGPHQLVATKPGFQTADAALVLLPGKELVHTIRLELIEVRTKLVRRWKVSTPWIVAGAGLGTSALGVVATYLARQEYATYDQLVAAQCPDGCGPNMPPGMQTVDPSTASHKTRGKILNVGGVGLVGVGGATAITGLILVYLNQPRSVPETAPPIVTPSVTPTAVGATVTWSF